VLKTELNYSPFFKNRVFLEKDEKNRRIVKK